MKYIKSAFTYIASVISGALLSVIGAIVGMLILLLVYGIVIGLLVTFVGIFSVGIAVAGIVLPILYGADKIETWVRYTRRQRRIRKQQQASE